MTYLLDTNIILIYLRGKSQRIKIEEQYDPFGANNNPVISVVTVGEIKSIAKRNYWGVRKLNLLEDILNSLIITDINSEDVIERYAEIDAFSQNKLKENPLSMTPRNMGKNDLWIAATASIANAVLLTTDNDFAHLENAYLRLANITV